MSYSKRQIVEQAFEELGLATYVFDMTPDQFDSALKRLDAMIAEWCIKGIDLGYPITADPESSELASSSNVPTWASQALISNLALKIAPSYGKSPSPDTKQSAKTGYESLLIMNARPIQQQLPRTMPIGAAGWRWSERTYVYQPDTKPLSVSDNGSLTFKDTN